MTDASYPASAITGHDNQSASLPPQTNGSPSPNHVDAVIDGVQEDDGQISCLCGFTDDDGWTVACDTCNRWQHQLCYYPQYEDRRLPEDLQHWCLECRPRPFDVQGARARQQVRREEQALANGVKRVPPKSHKKKPKDPAVANGWPLDKTRQDPNSASPRDQPPPAKRPKTTHRASDSTNGASTKTHSRKRNVSSVDQRRSLSGERNTNIDLYSNEFLTRYRNDEWVPAPTNLHNSIGVTNSLSEWLSAPETVFRDVHGHDKTEVLMRWDGELDEIPGKADIEIQQVHDSRWKDEQDRHPGWKRVTVKESVASGAYIGELKGHVGFKQDYQQDPCNRWDLLRHPEPFVFFHPRLPIYIDARHEGTELRYIRRSCDPNARLQVLVTDATDYRFCFMATRQIDPEEEVAVGWDTSDGLPDLIQRTQNGISQRDMEYLSFWVSTVLSNCGPCACNNSPADCAMSRFDRRGLVWDWVDDPNPPKMPPKPKRKKAQHVSPLNTNFNSRSGSEARKVDAEDEPTDSRSASGSNGRGTTSRDVTPNTHYSHTGSTSNMNELSERERKKLAKEEEMFRRQEEEQTVTKGKKKRNSGGSNLNTPGPMSSKPSGFGGSSKGTDTNSSRQSGMSGARSGKKTKPADTQKAPTRTVHKIVRTRKPDYANAETQCDLDEDAAKRAESAGPRRPFLPLQKRLLQRCALNNAREKQFALHAATTPHQEDDMCIDQPDTAPTASSSEPPCAEAKMEPADEPAQQPSKDTEMIDADADADSEDDKPISAQLARTAARDAIEQKASTPEKPASTSSTSHLPTDPPAPPWPSQASHTSPQAPGPPPIEPPTESPNMQLSMPPPPSNPFSTTNSNTATATSPTALTQSPAPLTTSSNPQPIFSPAVAAAVNPSPVGRKKLSLSDYTKRSKGVHREPSSSLEGGGGVSVKGERDDSPWASSTVGVVPPLPSGLSSRASEAVVDEEGQDGKA